MNSQESFDRAQREYDNQMPVKPTEQDENWTTEDERGDRLRDAEIDEKMEL